MEPRLGRIEAAAIDNPFQSETEVQILFEQNHDSYFLFFWVYIILLALFMIFLSPYLERRVRLK